ncbi:hypothetical protein NQZ68_007226 [Dissostichus eleginoides]|nr:hypothetical protein NQZ68_007226 [Dissostichus eleginoides]
MERGEGGSEGGCRPLLLSNGSTVIGLKSRDGNTGRVMGLKVIDKGCGEKTLPDVVKVLFQSGELSLPRVVDLR